MISQAVKLDRLHTHAGDRSVPLMSMVLQKII